MFVPSPGFFCRNAATQRELLALTSYDTFVHAASLAFERKSKDEPNPHKEKPAGDLPPGAVRQTLSSDYFVGSFAAAASPTFCT